MAVVSGAVYGATPPRFLQRADGTTVPVKKFRGRIVVRGPVEALDPGKKEAPFYNFSRSFQPGMLEATAAATDPESFAAASYTHRCTYTVVHGDDVLSIGPAELRVKKGAVVGTAIVSLRSAELPTDETSVIVKGVGTGAAFGSSKDSFSVGGPQAVEQERLIAGTVLGEVEVQTDTGTMRTSVRVHGSVRASTAGGDLLIPVAEIGTPATAR
jgi:hypothetical protein